MRNFEAHESRSCGESRMPLLRDWREGLENVSNNVSNRFSSKIACRNDGYSECSVRYSFESPFLKIRGPFNRGKVSTRGTRPCETMRIEVGERWLGTKSARDSSSRPFKSAYTRSRLFLHAFLGLCVRVQPLSLVDSRHRCLSHAGMTFRRTCSSWFPRFSFAEKKIEKRRLWIPEEFVFEYIYAFKRGGLLSERGMG